MRKRKRLEIRKTDTKKDVTVLEKLRKKEREKKQRKCQKDGR